jgi:hypothetical protein
MDFVGDAVVVWEQNDNIAAIRVSAAGVQQGNQINIASSSAIELAPSVALRRDGGAFVVTYESITTSVRSKVAEVSALTSFEAFKHASRMDCENGRSCVPAATSRLSAGGLRAS